MSGSTIVTTLVCNERTKLLANALDRASTAVGAGGVFPLLQAWRATQAEAGDAREWFFVASGYIQIFRRCHAKFDRKACVRVLR